MRTLMIREDVPPRELRRLAKIENDPRVARRLLAIAAALDGMSRDAAARIAGMDRQTLRDWVIRYNRGGPAGLSDHAGQPRWFDLRAPPPTAQNVASLCPCNIAGGLSRARLNTPGRRKLRPCLSRWLMGSMVEASRWPGIRATRQRSRRHAGEQLGRRETRRRTPRRALPHPAAPRMRRSDEWPRPRYGPPGELPERRVRARRSRRHAPLHPARGRLETQPARAQRQPRPRLRGGQQEQRARRRRRRRLARGSPRLAPQRRSPQGPDRPAQRPRRARSAPRARRRARPAKRLAAARGPRARAAPG